MTRVLQGSVRRELLFEGHPSERRPGAVYGLHFFSHDRGVRKGAVIGTLASAILGLPQAARILFPEPAAFKGRPLTPLHGGHVALCAVSGGMLHGVFGSGKDLHVATWQAVKVVDSSEETEEDGTIIQRERERFTNELALVYASGETAILR